MPTKKTDISSEMNASGGIPAAKSLKQKTMDEVLPKSNPNIPLRPMNNNDPNKPIDAKEMNTIAAANSNHGIKNPPASPYGRGITEPAVPGAVDPNSASYAARQQAAFRAGMQQAAAGKLSAEDRLMLRGVDQNVSRGLMPTISPVASVVPTATGRPTASTASTATGRPTGTTEAAQKYLQDKLGPEGYKVFQSMPKERQEAIYSKYAEMVTKNAPAATTAALPKGSAPSPSARSTNALPSGNTPIPTRSSTTSAPAVDTSNSPGGGTAEYMLRTLQDNTASPEARAQAGTYLKVRTMYAQPEKYGKEIKLLEKLERAKKQELRNMFRNRLNIRDPRFARQYAQYQALQKKDPQARLALYTELMQGPEFAHLEFRK